MLATARRAISAYANIGIETGVQAADPHQLILMLFEGALLAVADARLHMERGEVAAKGEAISKAIMIIDNGLKASLDVRSGGELGERLYGLYEYMSRRLLHANLHDRPEVLGEVRQLLSELHAAWAAIGRQPLAAGGAASAASSGPAVENVARA